MQGNSWARFSSRLNLRLRCFAYAEMHGPLRMTRTAADNSPSAPATAAPMDGGQSLAHPRVGLVYFDAGGGHRAAAFALTESIGSRLPEWQVERINLQEILDAVDPFLAVTGIRLQDIYNSVLSRGWTIGSRQMLPVLHGLIRWRHRKIVATLTQFWRTHAFDVVVSVVPNFNRALAQSVRAAMPSVPYVTILTDIADFPPHFWIERESQYLICGSDHARRQAGLLGHHERVFLTSGMVLKPLFY
jgi:hypothetical protein